MSKLIKQLNLTHERSVRKLDLTDIDMTADAKQDIRKICNCSPLYSEDTIINCNVIQITDGYQVRGVSFVVEKFSTELGLVIDFSPQGTIESVYFAIDSFAYCHKNNLFYTETKNIKENEVIINFLERLRTAFLIRDLKYIFKVMLDNDEELSILNGTEMQKSNSDMINKYLFSGLGALIKSISSDEFVLTSKYNIVDFVDIEILRHPANSKILSMRFRLTWRNSDYMSDCWLFSVLSFLDSKHMCFCVSSWHSYIFDEDIYPIEEVCSLADFTF
ncbi:MAG: hypothetical protein R3Y26_05575 [Rikenellaceae bacterium]